MGEEVLNTMNLDLNLGPFSSPDNEPTSGSSTNESVNLEEWIDEQRANQLREVFRTRRHRWRSLWRPLPVPTETRTISVELMINSINTDGSSVQTGQGSVSSEERNNEIVKIHQNNTTLQGKEALEEKEDEEKGSGEEGSFFYCNICLDLARDPVVTCCGHLFCWVCLYRWLHIHSNAKECPVCKGEVSTDNVTPIYGRGNNTNEPEDDLTLKIPVRPHARHVESWRQTIQRNAFTIPVEGMIRRLGGRSDWTRDLIQVQPQNANSISDLPERNNSLLNRILTSRGMRREQNTLVPQDDVAIVDLARSIPTNSDMGESRHFNLLPHRSHTNRAATISNLTSTLSYGERFRLVESYFGYHQAERNQEQPSPVDDRDSISSIAAVIHSESQTVDTAAEIDSTVSLSTSSSRRRNDTSRVSDVDSHDSRAHRRRRLN